MNIPEFFVERWESEQPTFARVLRALPADKLDYRPHERSSSAGDLAWQMVIEHGMLSDLIDSGEIHYQPREKPATLDAIVAEWEKSAQELRKRLKDLDEAKYGGPAKILAGGKTVMSNSVGNILWSFLLDLIHHRGQISTYIRPMGGKVPQIYGPSGDA
ncbi:MAG TPA: DinB family protein [Thermoanaerobaculia bacterium]|nr:DinB family protein [Thermoanaerobaculia bacterium]